jgi:hypothetical protein
MTGSDDDFDKATLGDTLEIFSTGATNTWTSTACTGATSMATGTTLL